MSYTRPCLVPYTRPCPLSYTRPCLMSYPALPHGIRGPGSVAHQVRFDALQQYTLLCGLQGNHPYQRQEVFELGKVGQHRREPPTAEAMQPLALVLQLSCEFDMLQLAALPLLFNCMMRGDQPQLEENADELLLLLGLDADLGIRPHHMFQTLQRLGLAAGGAGQAEAAAGGGGFGADAVDDVWWWLNAAAGYGTTSTDMKDLCASAIVSKAQFTGKGFMQRGALPTTSQRIEPAELLSFKGSLEAETQEQRRGVAKLAQLQQLEAHAAAQDGPTKELLALFRQYRPEFVERIPSLLQRYKGYEAELWQSIRDKYEGGDAWQPAHSPLAHDPLEHQPPDGAGVVDLDPAVVSAQGRLQVRGGAATASAPKRHARARQL